MTKKMAWAIGVIALCVLAVFAGRKSNGERIALRASTAEAPLAQREEPAVETPDDVYRKTLYQKTEKHADLCRSVCGVRYDKIEIRGAAQTKDYDSVVVCLDTSAADMKNGQSFDDARAANDCNETHGDWCITYGKRYDDVDLGVYAQCAGLKR